VRDLTIREDEVIPSQETCVPVSDNTLRAKLMHELNFCVYLQSTTLCAVRCDACCVLIRSLTLLAKHLSSFPEQK